MTSDAIRNAFLKYFEKRGHTVIASSSLIPDNDPSVLLTTAGMQQLKPYFMGEKNPLDDYGSRRLVSSQRCFRTSDIEAVGDSSHDTFFEMLGNFSLNDYFKEEAITYAWEFITEVTHVPSDRLWATIFAGDQFTPRDDDAEKLWRRVLPKERISANGRDDNFWGPSGNVGPCGPSSELHVDLRGFACDRGNNCLPNCPCERFMELWNLVFTEWGKKSDGTFVPLATKNIDTGMGLERLALIVQQKKTIFETDVFSTIMQSVVAANNNMPDEDHRLKSNRIITDHLRAAMFLIADGVLFSNKDQGYILRRIVRRALDHCVQPEIDLQPIVRAVVETYARAYPELNTRQPMILETLNAEQRVYAHVAKQDIAYLVSKIRGRNSTSNNELLPEEAFALYATHGISLLRLEREGFTFDRTAVEHLTVKHQERSREGSAKKFGGHGLAHGIATAGRSPEDIDKITRLHSATHLLHAALRSILGTTVQQNGSDITPERLRFDFSFPRKLTDQEKHDVENLVNEKIREDLPVRWEILPYEEAIRQDALAFFREKYEARVKVYSMGTFSKELCGGPHVEHTGQVGTFKILSEKSVAAGMRRVKAIVEG